MYRIQYFNCFEVFFVWVVSIFPIITNQFSVPMAYLGHWYRDACPHERLFNVEDDDTNKFL